MTDKLTITCEDWRVLRRNTLQGFASVEIVELGLTIREIAVHRRGDRTWAALPARPWIKDGAVVTGDDGKAQYSPLLEFSRREVRDAFSRAVVDAVIRFDPKALSVDGVT